MDINRLQKNIKNRDWDKYSKDTNIKYLKRKLKQFDIDIPKYLKDKKLTQKNINALTNKILKAIDKNKHILITTPDKPKKELTYEQAYKKLEKVIDSHNKTVIKKLPKISHLSDNKFNFLVGNDVRVGEKGLYRYRNNVARDDSQFKTINIESMRYSDVKAILRDIERIKKLTKRLTNENIKKEIKFSPVAVNSIRLLLQTYVNDSYLSSNDFHDLMSRVKALDGIQQEMLQQLFSSSGLQVKYVITDDEMDSFKSNLYNKLDRLLNMCKDE